MTASTRTRLRHLAVADMVAQQRSLRWRRYCCALCMVRATPVGGWGGGRETDHHQGLDWTSSRMSTAPSPPVDGTASSILGVAPWGELCCPAGLPSQLTQVGVRSSGTRSAGAGRRPVNHDSRSSVGDGGQQPGGAHDGTSPPARPIISPNRPAQRVQLPGEAIGLEDESDECRQSRVTRPLRDRNEGRVLSYLVGGLIATGDAGEGGSM